jgi:pimeloyl-ACP methyl ester carboxylesterase
VRLAYSESGDGPPLVVLHGLFGSGRNWHGIARRLSGYRVVVADARNHGASPWVDAMDYASMADDVFELIGALALDRPVLLGHSMGGKTAMTAALMRPGSIRALIVADIAPAAYAHSHLSMVRAMQAVDLAPLRRRADADAALAAAAPEPAMRDFLLQNLVFDAGRARWRINLEAIAANMAALTGWTLPRGADVYSGPSLFVHGGTSSYVTAAHRGAILRLFPNASVVAIEGAGHWLHAERPGAFVASVERFLKEEI